MFNLLHLKYSKHKLENEIFFLILRKYNRTQIQQLQLWYSKSISNEKLTFNQNAIAVSLTFFQFSFSYNPAFYFNMGKKLWRHNYSLPHVSVIAGNILITIVRFACYHLLLASNSTFMTDYMYLGTIKTCRNLTLLFNFNYICDLTNRRKLFSIVLDMLPFQIRLEHLKN